MWTAIYFGQLPNPHALNSKHMESVIGNPGLGLTRDWEENRLRGYSLHLGNTNDNTLESWSIHYGLDSVCVEISYILWCRSITSYANATTYAKIAYMASCGWWKGDVGSMWGHPSTIHNSPRGRVMAQVVGHEHNSSRIRFRLSLTSVQSWRKRSVLRRPMNESHIVILQKNQYTSAYTIITH